MKNDTDYSLRILTECTQELLALISTYCASKADALHAYELLVYSIRTGTMLTWDHFEHFEHQGDGWIAYVNASDLFVAAYNAEIEEDEP